MLLVYVFTIPSIIILDCTLATYKKEFAVSVLCCAGSSLLPFTFPRLLIASFSLVLVFILCGSVQYLLYKLVAQEKWARPCSLTVGYTT